MYTEKNQLLGLGTAERSPVPFNKGEFTMNRATTWEAKGGKIHLEFSALGKLKTHFVKRIGLKTVQQSNLCCVGKCLSECPGNTTAEWRRERASRQMQAFPQIVPDEYVSNSFNNSGMHCIFEWRDTLICSPLLLWSTGSNPILLPGGHLLSIVPYLLHFSPHPQCFVFLRPVRCYKFTIILFSLLNLLFHLMLSAEDLFPSQTPVAACDWGRQSTVPLTPSRRLSQPALCLPPWLPEVYSEILSNPHSVQNAQHSFYAGYTNISISAVVPFLRITWNDKRCSYQYCINIMHT